MSKEEESSAGPRQEAEGLLVSGGSGPVVQSTMVRDTTLKLWVPQGADAEQAIDGTELETPAASASWRGEDSLNATDAALVAPQVDCQGALPEPIHEPLVEGVHQKPDSLEIMISEGTVQIETDPAVLGQESNVPESGGQATPLPSPLAQSAEQDPAWATVTPPPKLADGSALPSPRYVPSPSGEPEAVVLTPPPAPKTPSPSASDVAEMVIPIPRASDADVMLSASRTANVAEETNVVAPLTGLDTPAIVAASPESTAVLPDSLQSPMDSIDFPIPDEDDRATPSLTLPPAERGATPDALIRMAETAEVAEGDFEVMEPAESARENQFTPSPNVPPPVPVHIASPAVDANSDGRRGEELPEALSRRTLKKDLRPWYEEVFDEDYLRTLPFMTAQQTLRETAFMREALLPPPEGEILDVACGYGRHAIEFGQRGFRVTGLDLSLPLLIRAADESQRRGLSINFVHADMREMAYESRFDSAYCVLTSFGYFDEETNLRVASSIFRALKPGGRFLIDIINRDYVVSDLPSRVWWEGDGCVVLEEVDFDFHTSRVVIRRSIVFGDGRQVEQEISIRAYSLYDLGRILRRAGFQILDVSGGLASNRPFLGGSSRQMVVVCERPST